MIRDSLSALGGTRFSLQRSYASPLCVLCLAWNSMDADAPWVSLSTGAAVSTTVNITMRRSARDISGSCIRRHFQHGWTGLRHVMKKLADSLADLGRFSEPALLILISLADGPKHGYAMTVDIAALSGQKLGLVSCMAPSHDSKRASGSNRCRPTIAGVRIASLPRAIACSNIASTVSARWRASAPLGWRMPRRMTPKRVARAFVRLYPRAWRADTRPNFLRCSTTTAFRG